MEVLGVWSTKMKVKDAELSVIAPVYNSNIQETGLGG